MMRRESTEPLRIYHIPGGGQRGTMRAGTTVNASFSVPRMTSIAEATSILSSVKMRCRSSTLVDVLPAQETITVAGSRMPASSAGHFAFDRHHSTPCLAEGRKPRHPAGQRHVVAVQAEVAPHHAAVLNQCGRMNLAVLIGMAKQMPCAGRMTAVLTPMTSPRGCRRAARRSCPG